VSTLNALYSLREFIQHKELFMASTTYTSVTLKALQALFKETRFSDQNQEIAIAVLVHQKPVAPFAAQYGVSRANIYKMLKKVSESLTERNSGNSFAWITASHHLPLAISREITQWELSVKDLSEADATKAIEAFQRAIFKCRGQLLDK
jgi:TrfB plasmid transcriptional repressor